MNKAKQRLDTLRSAIHLYEAQRGKYIHATQAKLLGRYIQEIFPDPWGRNLIIEPTTRRIGTLGRDGFLGGTGDDEDIFLELGLYRPAPKPLPSTASTASPTTKES